MKELMLISVTFHSHMVKSLRSKGENILRYRNKSYKIYSINYKLKKQKKDRILEIKHKRIVIIKTYFFS